MIARAIRVYTVARAGLMVQTTTHACVDRGTRVTIASSSQVNNYIVFEKYDNKIFVALILIVRIYALKMSYMLYLSYLSYYCLALYSSGVLNFLYNLHYL